MKVVAFNGSSRKEGNTSLLITEVFKELQKQNIETEEVSLAGQKIRGCVNCLQCRTKPEKKCAIKDDLINSCIEKMIEADGIILASPTYFADITPEIKALIDRAGRVAKANGDMFRRKVGAGIVAVRRGGAIHALDSLNHFFLIGQMIMPSSSYWNIGIGKEIGDVLQDKEGLDVMRILGENMAWLLQKLS